MEPPAANPIRHEAHILKAFDIEGSQAGGLSRSHLINARTSRKRRHLQDETVESQTNHHFLPEPIAAGLWFSCHKTIYEITSSFTKEFCRPRRSCNGEDSITGPA